MKGFIKLTIADDTALHVQFHDIVCYSWNGTYGEVGVRTGLNVRYWNIKDSPEEIDVLRREAYVQDLLTGWEDMKDERLLRNDPHGLYEEDDGSVRPLDIKRDL